MFKQFDIDFEDITVTSDIPNSSGRILGPSYYTLPGTFKVVAPLYPDAEYKWTHGSLPVSDYFNRQALTWQSAEGAGQGNYYCDIYLDGALYESHSFTVKAGPKSTPDIQLGLAHIDDDFVMVPVNINVQDNLDTKQWQYTWTLKDGTELVQKDPGLLFDKDNPPVKFTAEINIYSYYPFKQSIDIEIEKPEEPDPYNDQYNVLGWRDTYVLVGHWVIEDIRFCRLNGIDYEDICNGKAPNRPIDKRAGLELYIRDTAATRAAVTAWKAGLKVQDATNGNVYSNGQFDS